MNAQQNVLEYGHGILAAGQNGPHHGSCHDGRSHLHLGVGIHRFAQELPQRHIAARLPARADNLHLLHVQGEILQEIPERSLQEEAYGKPRRIGRQTQNIKRIGIGDCHALVVDRCPCLHLFQHGVQQIIGHLIFIAKKHAAKQVLRRLALLLGPIDHRRVAYDLRMFAISKQGIERRAVGKRRLLRHGSIATLLAVVTVGFIGISIEGDEQGSRCLGARDTFERRMLDGDRRQCARHEAAAFFLRPAGIEVFFPCLTHGRIFVHEGARHTKHEVRPRRNLGGIGCESRMCVQHLLAALPTLEKGENGSSRLRLDTA